MVSVAQDVSRIPTTKKVFFSIRLMTYFMFKSKPRLQNTFLLKLLTVAPIMKRGVIVGYELSGFITVEQAAQFAETTEQGLKAHLSVLDHVLD